MDNHYDYFKNDPRLKTSYHSPLNEARRMIKNIEAEHKKTNQASSK